MILGKCRGCRVEFENGGLRLDLVKLLFGVYLVWGVGGAFEGFRVTVISGLCQIGTLFYIINSFSIICFHVN
jgi:hypothetical protein